MRDQLTQQLSDQGELPVGVQLDVPKIYAQMTGQGELWVGENGLPIRQQFHLDFPEQDDSNLIATDVKVDFSDFAPRPEAARPAHAIGGTVLGAFTPAGASPALALVAVLGLMAIVVTRGSSQRVYGAVVIAVIVSMLLTPLLGSRQISAFMSRQAAKRDKQAAQQADQQAREEMKAQMLQPAFDPHTDPLAEAQAQSDLLDAINATTTSTTWNPYADSSCQTDPNGDVDGDGLTNLEECQLGT